MVLREAARKSLIRSTAYWHQKSRDRRSKKRNFCLEFQFDRYFPLQGLDQSFGRPYIFLQATNECIGYCRLMPWLCEPGVAVMLQTSEQCVTGFASIEAEAGWAIWEQHRSKGFATEAARALIDYGFNELHLPRIVAFTEDDNLPSRRVMEKLGMALHVDAATHSVIAWLDNKNPSK
jgi:RimJ/RimL family protein N-acetyltransferase